MTLLDTRFEQLLATLAARKVIGEARESGRLDRAVAAIACRAEDPHSAARRLFSSWARADAQADISNSARS